MKVFSIKNYNERVIIWKRHDKESVYWYSQIEEELMFLRMNNFPEEPLYTFISKTEIRNFNELPEKWVVEN